MNNGNRTGRPNSTTRTSAGPISQIFMQRATVPKPGDKENRTRIEAVVDKVIDKAEEGDIKAAALTFNYIQGKPAQTVSVQQALWVLENATDEELAAAAQMPAHELRSERKKHLLEAKAEIVPDDNQE